MSVHHKNLTGTDLHEPKGVAGAATGTVYIANGSGSGSWTKLTAANLDFSAFTNGNFVIVSAGVPDEVTLNNANLIYLNCFLVDAANAEDAWVVSPQDGTITTIWTTIYNACDSNTVITPSIGGVNITDGAISITASGSQAGDVDSSTPSANNDISAGQAIRFLSDGGASGALPVMITIEIDVT